jgi:hypothetical protein
MKSIKQQYIDLTEGKMSQGNFMRNLRMTMPQYVTNVTSFGDAVKILKNKGIISEALTTEEEEVFSQGAQDESITTTNTTAGFDSVSEEDEDKTSDEDAEFDAILKQLEDEMAGEIAVKSDRMEEPLEEEEQLNENKEPKAVDENLEEVTLGITTEHECFPELDYDAIEKMVKKNIKKNPLYYTNYKLTGIRDYEVQTMDSSKPEDHQMKFYTEKTAVDTARGMKKIKVEKKKIKEAMEVDQTGQLKPQLPTSSDTERLLKFLKNNTTFVGMLKNIDNVTELAQFWRELLQLTDPELQALSDTQLQSIFRKAVLDYRKETGVPNQIFSKNANIQAGINKIKEADEPQDDKVEMELSSALSQNPTLKRILQKVDLPGEVNGTIKALLDRTNLKNIPDQIILSALRKVLADTPGPSFTAQFAANANIGKPNPALGKTLEEKLRSMVREILAEEAPSKKTAASEITAKAVDVIDDRNEGEGKEYKKKWLEDVFDSYEDKVGQRFDDSVFEDVIDMLKSKGYTMTMKETFDGRDNLTNISDDTK